MVVHVDDCLHELEWLLEEFKKKYDLKKHVSEVIYLNRVPKSVGGGKHACDEVVEGLRTAWWNFGETKRHSLGAVRRSRVQATMPSREKQRVKRAGGCHHQLHGTGRPDLSGTARVLSQWMANPTTGIEGCLESTIISSGEADSNIALNSVWEAIGVLNALRELFCEDRGGVLSVDATACNGMLLRTGTGKVEHLTTKQLWVQRTIQSYGVEVQKLPRASTASDILTHAVGESELREGLHRMGYHPPQRSRWSIHERLGTPARLRVQQV